MKVKKKLRESKIVQLHKKAKKTELSFWSFLILIHLCHILQNF